GGEAKKGRGEESGCGGVSAHGSMDSRRGFEHSEIIGGEAVVVTTRVGKTLPQGGTRSTRRGWNCGGCSAAWANRRENAMSKRELGWLEGLVSVRLIRGGGWWTWTPHP